MFYPEAVALYKNVHTQGKKMVSSDLRAFVDPYLHLMDNEVDESNVTQKVDLGILEIPVRQIVGVASASPDLEYTYDFKPLADSDSNFAESWCQLYLAYLSDKGLEQPIECVEYMGRFYVVDGKKRVSVLKAHGERRVTAHVIRWIPECSGGIQWAQYQEFLKHFPVTGLYEIFFSDASDYQYLQDAMGLASEKIWTDMDRYHFMFTFMGVERAYFKLVGEFASFTAADVFAALLKKFGFAEVRAMHPWDLDKEINAMLHSKHEKKAA